MILPAAYTISLEQDAMQIGEIHRWLATESHWARGIPLKTVQRAVANSAVAGVFADGRQIGFARLITDYAVFAYLADVYIEQAHRGKGLGKILCATLLGQDWVQDLRRVLLSTKDAHGLYAQLDFKPLRYPERLMEILHENNYHEHSEKPAGPVLDV